MSTLLLPDIEPMAKAKSLPPPDRKNNGRSKTMTNSFSTSQLQKIRKPRLSRTPSGLPKKRHSEKIPRKLGPRDVGKVRYKGTKYEEKETGHWLDEKIHRHARTSSFLARKRVNPLEPKAGFDGSPQNWDKPAYYRSEVAKMKNHRHSRWGHSVDFMDDKPLKPGDRRLKALKNVKIPKSQKVGDLHQPFGWTPISYAISSSDNSGDFLEEKLWFEGSKVSDSSGLSKLIEALPARKKLQLSAMAAPTGYLSKINYLKALRDLVMSEIQRIHKEDNKLMTSLTTVLEHSHSSNDAADSADEQREDQKVIDMMAQEINDDFEKNVELAMKEVFDEPNTLKLATVIEVTEEARDDNTRLDEHVSTSLLPLRQLFTMKSVNRLTGIIENIEQTQKSMANDCAKYALKN